MNTLLNITEKYIEYCETQKCLNSKTLIYMPFPYPILKTTLVIYTAVSNPKQLKENLQLSNPFTLSSNIKITLKKILLVR